VNNWVLKLTSTSHRHDATGIVQRCLMWTYEIGPFQARSIGRKRIDERVIVGIQDPVDSMPCCWKCVSGL
jgi:hypothetical protein